MTENEFNSLVLKLHKKELALLEKKKAIYTGSGDRLANFKGQASLKNESPEKALLGNVSKQIITLVDYINRGEIPDSDLYNELILDIRNYMALLKAVYDEKVMKIKL